MEPCLSDEFRVQTQRYKALPTLSERLIDVRPTFIGDDN